MAGPVRIKASRTVTAPAEQVYGILSDYRVGHPSILPARAFAGLTVEEGGQGAGTVIRFGMRSFGSVKWVRAQVEEPVPGRVLVERVVDEGDVVTTFTVEPEGDDRSTVTIDTHWTPQALLERLLGPFLLKGIYAEELANLEKVATGAL